MLIAQRQPIPLPLFTVKVSTAPKQKKLDRAAIYIRDGGICHICKKNVSRKRFTLDHLIPRIAGGPDVEPNVAIAHPRCNQERFIGRRIAAQLRVF